MLLLSEAYDILDRELRGTSLPNEEVNCRDAIGRIVVEDYTSTVDLPPFNKSAMDGYALPEGDIQDTYYIAEEVRAGCMPIEKLASGTAAKVMTGSPVPVGTGRVIMKERTFERGGRITVHTPDTSINICWKGEDIRCGDPVVTAFTCLDSVCVANLISCGIDKVKVVRRVRVAIISTGDEIVDHPAQLAPGRIINTNGPLLASLCLSYGFELVSNEVVPDDAAKTVLAIQQASSQADIIIISGGVSVGDFDFVRDVLKGAGFTTHFSHIAVKPGKPMTFAKRANKAIFGMPGNPVAVYLMFHLFILRAAGIITGSQMRLREIPLPLVTSFKRRKNVRCEFVPGRLSADGKICKLDYHGSAHLLSIMKADGFFLVPIGISELKKGQLVTFLPVRLSSIANFN